MRERRSPVQGRRVAWSETPRDGARRWLGDPVDRPASGCVRHGGVVIVTMIVTVRGVKLGSVGPPGGAASCSTMLVLTRATAAPAARAICVDALVVVRAWVPPRRVPAIEKAGSS